ncbi:hypothetical protein PUNSTDRAFT_132352 [Punctularia strigosozonata HHB-11173 SS5]|uniref:uncharacterized protein n=1 Tax=Punctularia strigosozonata (strain HHB-11173) TaxID=741275 RepID=UPI0004417E34|nr:uncharacterized protein PUNSTDRAFT_132352 [Punctularia strigosozonata HHB-11173 SS5]EIN10259.1 hypothetical protein PUNSTDRAFT_132352 [Punctularia strigosozonata HHB-11173 SS5]
MDRSKIDSAATEEFDPCVCVLESPRDIPPSAGSLTSDEGTLPRTPSGAPSSRRTATYTGIGIYDADIFEPLDEKYDASYGDLDVLGKGWLDQAPGKKALLLRSSSAPRVVSYKHVSRGIHASTAPHAQKPKWVRLPKAWLWDKSFGRVDIIVWHCLFVAVTPAFFAFAVKLIHDLSVTRARLLVAILCAAFGILVGSSLTELAQPWLEAAQRRFILQNSQLHNHRMTSSKATDLMTSPKRLKAAVSLAWRRLRYNEEFRRQGHIRGPGVGSILFFVFLFVVGQCISFALGRAVIIDAVVKHQYKTAELVAVAADLAPIDIQRANASQAVFNDYQSSWTFYSTAVGSGLSRNVSFHLTGDLASEFGNDTVYFAELEPSQMLPWGSGLGSFDSDQATQPDMSRASALNPSETPGLGNLLRFPRWGIRIHCQKLPDPAVHLRPVAASGSTYIYIPRDLIKSLYESFDIQLPDALENTTFDPSLVLAPDDTMPSGFNVSDILYGVRFYNNGVGHSLWSRPTDMGDAGDGWKSIEAVLVRLNNTYADAPTFPIYGPESNDTASYDAAVCIRLIEPWIVEAYNSTVSAPSSLRIVSRQAAAVPRGLGTKDDTPGFLNSTGKWPAYVAAHGNSVNQIEKDNGRDAWYIPSPTMVSFTDGSGPRGYTELNPSRVAETRALADSLNLLPYLSGSGQLTSVSFADKTFASARVDWRIMGTIAGVLLSLGVLARFLPHENPSGMEVQPRNMRSKDNIPLYRGG